MALQHRQLGSVGWGLFRNYRQANISRFSLHIQVLKNIILLNRLHKPAKK